MTAWKHTARARARRQVIARIVIVVTVAGEAICLYHAGLHADFVAAYTIVSAWTKDFVHRTLVGMGAAVNNGGPFYALHPLALEVPDDLGGELLPHALGV